MLKIKRIQSVADAPEVDAGRGGQCQGSDRDGCAW